jgi:hypothetical protein
MFATAAMGILMINATSASGQRSAVNLLPRRITLCIRRHISIPLSTLCVDYQIPIGFELAYHIQGRLC